MSRRTPYDSRGEALARHPRAPFGLSGFAAGPTVAALLLGSSLLLAPGRAQTPSYTAPVSTASLPLKAALALTPEEQAWLRAHPVIRVAQEQNWAPIEFSDKQGLPVGIAHDYLRLIEQRLGVSFQQVTGLSWQDAYARMKRWEIDMTTSVAETPVRREFWAFTKPYMEIPSVILTHADVTYIATLKDLAGKKVAAVDGYIACEKIPQDFPAVELVKVKSVREGLELLRRREIFAFVDNMLVTDYYLSKMRRKDLKIAGITPYVNAQTMAVRKDWAPLAGILQKALDSISDEERNAIYHRWVPSRYGGSVNYPLLRQLLALFAAVVAALLFWNQKMAREIRHRKRVEAALSESEENYRKLFEDHAAIKLLINPNTGAIVDANTAAAAFYGWTREQLKRMSIQQINQQPPEAVFRAMHDIELNSEAHFEFRHRLADGSIRDVEVFSSRIKMKDGYFLHSIVHDITGRKRIEAERERLLAAIEQADEAIVISSAEMVVLYVNPAFEAITGKSRAEAIGHPSDFATRDDAREPTFREQIESVLKSGKTWKGRFENTRKNGSRYWAEATISPVRDASGQIVNYVSIERDITSHLELTNRLQQAQRMESVGRLAGGVAHEFNNMLQIILGHAELALDAVGPSGPASDDLQEIRKATKHSAELTRQLLAFARKQTIFPKVLDLNDTLAASLKMIAKLLGEGIALRWLPKAELWPVMMDASQVGQIVVNLSLNARDAISSTGTVTIETDNVVLDAGFCEQHPGSTPGDFAMIAISDTGSGIDEDALSHLFEPFFTTKTLGQGTGLGLATVYGIVKQNNGFISVRSERDKGTTFKVFLPRHAGVSRPERAASAKSPRLGKGETVLLVDDEPAILTTAKILLGKLGYQVFTAKSPTAALALAREHAGEIRLLLTDVVMPEMNGQELAIQIKALVPGIRLLFMSGYTANAIAHHGVSDTSVHFLPKPFSLDSLAEKVRFALDETHD